VYTSLNAWLIKTVWGEERLVVAKHSTLWLVETDVYLSVDLAYQLACPDCIPIIIPPRLYKKM
jgi:hypothetical protein